MIVYSEKYLEHNFENHPENNLRLKTTMNLLTKKDVFEYMPLVEPGYAGDEDILRVHTQEYFHEIKKSSSEGRTLLDADTYLNDKSFSTALLSAGGAITCIDKCLDGYDYSFALVRPPGHHAEKDRAMGFCIFNNVAVGARYAIEKHNLKRILIFDFDVHHGNGTQNIFFKDKNVLYLSIHQSPLYPGTGRMDEIGEGDGKGYNVNILLPPGTCDTSYLKAFDEIVLPIIQQFNPDLILVSAGYDGHFKDPLAELNLSTSCYYEIARRLKQKAKTKIIFSLEGGYNLNALADSIYATLAPFAQLNEKPAVPVVESIREGKRVTDYIDSRIETIKNIQSSYWEL